MKTPLIATNNNEEDQYMYPTKKKPLYSTYESIHTAVETNFYISDDIGEPSEYVDMIHRLNNATQDDVAVIHLNTSGGRLDTGAQIINAMNNSAAEVITVLSGVAYSLGTLVFLSGKRKVVHKNSIMMIHNFSGGVYGKGHEVRSQFEATERWFTQMARDIYIPFLTEDEFMRVTKGEDLWLLSDEIIDRLEKIGEMDIVEDDVIDNITSEASPAE